MMNFHFHIKGTGVNIRKAPVDGKIVCRLTTGNQITVTDQLRSDADGQIWYAISFLNNKKPENGYVRSDLTEGITPYESLTKTEEPKEESTGNTTEEPKQPESSASIKGMGVRIREKVVNGKNRRRGMVTGKTAKTKKAIVQLTEDSKDIEIFAGL